MNSKKQQLELTRLVLSALQGDISEEQSQVLMDTLNQNPEALSLYMNLMEIYTELSPLGSVRIPPISEPQLDSQGENFYKLLNLLAAEEKTAPTIYIPKPISEPDEKPVQARKVRKFKLWVKCLSLAALLFIIIFPLIMHYFETVPVATMTDSIHAEYGSEQFPDGSRLTNRKDPYCLQKGVVKLEFDSGAGVVIEAPAEFQLKSINKMVLHSGRLFAIVPDQARGFTVKTANSTVVDLGTKFGLDVTAESGTQLHVLSGETNLRVSMFKQTQVTTGQARSVDDNDRVEEIPIERYRFIRNIDSRANIISRGLDMISLTDLVMGGNGYGTSLKLSETYSVSTGQKTTDRNGQYRTLNIPYQKVTSNPFIDGIFVPNGKNQVVSSEGHVFADCPDTSGLYFYDLCFDKKWEYAPPAAQLYQKQRNLNFAPNLVFMHSNIGVTFNLDAVRRQFPGQSIRRFLASVGVMFSFGGAPIKEAEINSPKNTEFDVWVVVDEQLRSKAEKVRWDSLNNLDVPIMTGDRFLSVLVTDGGVTYESDTANHYDSCGLADMRFEMESME
ncbi:MAG: FecR domain-containing protein [Sedimentisphaerales bacterium]|nr:FecR domain-containing protein [Sedimentisphaerales bacterium]